ncbi:DsbE family thiol:disulfide interchange protein [Indioceanicola profundi]|uniref:DsbE family thiol:disulfide interchange protein n=1 Tax=Indioceanicola profundi TaxID=2220096 RepID=UPI000E6AB2FD|nr:DsbE family thiol:disulfide interchange protein [Indioceanicola profundi]
MPRLILFVPFALFLVLVGYFAVGLTRDPSELPSALIDQPVPQFELPPVQENGQGLATADLKGGVQLVNVFASWCAPCRIEHPLLMRLAKEEGVTIHGIAYKDKPQDSQRFLAQLGNPYQRIGADLDGRIGIEWGVYGVPETYIVDAEGRIRYRHVGPLMPFDLDEKILPLIRELQK